MSKWDMWVWMWREQIISHAHFDVLRIYYITRALYFSKTLEHFSTTFDTSHLVKELDHEPVMLKLKLCGIPPP